MKLFFDTETTGIVKFKEPINHPSQPRMIQLAAILVDDNDKEIANMDCIIKPDGFSIPAEAANIHGITTEIAQEKGIDLKCAITLFSSFLHNATMIIGHNIEFDKFILNKEFTEVIPEFAALNLLDNRAKFCTMHQSTKILKLPYPSGKAGYKWPKLSEAYRFAFFEDFTDAHNAMADVRATKRLYDWIIQYKRENSQTI